MAQEIKNVRIKKSKHDKIKERILELSKVQPLNTLKFQEDYFDIMGNNWLIDKYICKNGLVSADAPENSIKAYLDAVKKGYPIVISAQSLDDGTIICYKDKTLARANSNGYICKVGYDELKDLTLEKSNEHIPTLENALDIIKGKVPVIIDIVNDGAIGKVEENINGILEDYIAKYNLSEHVAIMSINPYTLEWFYHKAPWFPRILRSGKFKVAKYGSIKTGHLKRLKFHTITGADYVCYNACDLPCRHIKKVKPVGVIAYNVKSQQEYIKVAKYCDNIIFDGFVPTI